jgi:hypothetical protein
MAAILGSATAAFVAVVTTMVVGRRVADADDESGLNIMVEDEISPSTRHDSHGFFASEKDQ